MLLFNPACSSAHHAPRCSNRLPGNLGDQAGALLGFAQGGAVPGADPLRPEAGHGLDQLLLQRDREGLVPLADDVGLRDGDVGDHEVQGRLEGVLRVRHELRQPRAALRLGQVVEESIFGRLVDGGELVLPQGK